MVSKTSKILSEEHVNILKVIEILERECDLLEKGKNIDKEFFLEVIDFIKNYADKFHHAKEEDILFKEFCKKESELHCNPVEQMLHEHDMGRNFVKGISEGLEENNKEKIIENSIGYCRLLKDHIFKEDNILYPMTDEVINEKIQESMLKKFQDIENKRKKDKQKYLNFVNKISRR
ncbi:MAG: hemerythrin domain-containing protein [Nanoarchaeota archaeon]